MKKIRLYLKGNFAIPIQMSKENQNYLLRVMRLKSGDSIRIFNSEEGEWLATIAGNSLIAQEQIHPAAQKKMCMILAFTPTKGCLEEVLDKAVQLGCDGIIPVISERSVIKTINRERCEKIILEATEQSGRLIVPELADITTLNKLTAILNGMTFKRKILLCHPGASSSWRDISLDQDETLVILVGPEGGFSERDLNIFPDISLINLGKNILRAETATIVAMTLAKIIINQL